MTDPVTDPIPRDVGRRMRVTAGCLAAKRGHDPLRPTSRSIAVFTILRLIANTDFSESL